MRLSLRKPDNAEIAVYDLNSHPLHSLLPNRSTFWLAVRKEVLYVHPQVLYLWFNAFLKCRNKRLAYIIAILKVVRPKLVVTYIDTDRTFHEAASHFPNVRFVAVQNSFRYPNLCSILLPNSTYESTMLCFGQNEKTEYIQNKIKFGNIQVVGNIKADELTTKKKQTESERESLRLISEVTCNPLLDFLIPGYPTLEEFSEHWGIFTQEKARSFVNSIPKQVSVDDVLLSVDTRYQQFVVWQWLTLMKWTLEFAQTNANVKVEVLLRSNNDSRERALFREYGDAKWAQFTPQEFRSKRNTSGRHLYLSTRSSMGLDLLGAGRKTMFAQLGITNCEIRTYSAQWWLVNPTREEFMGTLRDLLPMEETEYHNRFHTSIDYYVANGPTSPSQTVASFFEDALAH